MGKTSFNNIQLLLKQFLIVVLLMLMYNISLGDQSEKDCDEIRRRLAIFEMYNGQDTIDIIKCLIKDEVNAKRIDTSNQKNWVHVYMYPFIKTYYTIDDFICKVSFRHSAQIIHSKNSINLVFTMFDLNPDSTATIEYYLGDKNRGILRLKKKPYWIIDISTKE